MKVTAMRWGVEKRLEFIEFRLFWEGGINRADIINQFGVSVPQASKDLTLYEEKAPGNLRYDKSAKRYRAAPDFKPAFLTPDSSAYLAHLQASNGEADAVSDTWLAATPEFDAMPIPNRRIDVGVLRAILTAIREKRSLEICYQSMSPKSPAPQWRRITPHAFGSDGLRWHARAFCHIDHKFKDFILSRCLDTRAYEDAGTTPEADHLWNDHFTVTLVPNPALSAGQKAIIARDYEMADGAIDLPVRKALLYYLQRRLRLDLVEEAGRPQETPIVVANRAAFDTALAEATS